MTTVAAIQNDLESLCEALGALGMSRANAELHIRANSSFYLIVGYYDEHEDYKHHSLFGDTAIEAISKMQDIIYKIPSRADRDRATYLKHIAKAIEFGKKIGIDEQFINPLELQMKRLSANIIEARPDIDDEIPF
jgi:hypothetical protein